MEAKATNLSVLSSTTKYKVAIKNENKSTLEDPGEF